MSWQQFMTKMASAWSVAFKKRRMMIDIGLDVSKNQPLPADNPRQAESPSPAPLALSVLMWTTLWLILSANKKVASPLFCILRGRSIGSEIISERTPGCPHAVLFTRLLLTPNVTKIAPVHLQKIQFLKILLQQFLSRIVLVLGGLQMSINKGAIQGSFCSLG